MAAVVQGTERWHVQHADCLYAMSCLPDACIDAIVCDPPYDLTAGKRGGSGVASVRLDTPYGRARIGTGNGAGGFMGKAWDATGIAFDPATWREALRVLKPGGHLLAFGGTRTFHRLTCAIEDAGFEIRDSIAWMHAQGFPKSLDVSKAIDRSGGGETAPQWEGWGTALKPAWEPVVVARKPLDGTVAANVLKHGTGALNIDGCRVHSGPSAGGSVSGDNAFGQDSGWNEHENRPTEIDRSMTAGRWPPNVVFNHAEGCRNAGTKRVPTATTVRKNIEPETMTSWMGRWAAPTGDDVTYADADRLETVAAWDCAPGCPVAALDAQSGTLSVTGVRSDRSAAATVAGTAWGTDNHRSTEYPGDTGAASRFFPQFQAGATDVPFYYTAKASTAERTVGLNERSIHPTMKPVNLMRWLIRLATPPGGLVLDPFTGSGSTGVAAMLEGGGFRFLGIEREPEYVAIAEQRIKHVAGGRWRTPEQVAAEAAAMPEGKKKQLTLF
jgi:site-specific DNA-methyltransferase (adenine-specific)